MNFKLCRAICPMLLFCFCFAQCKKHKETPKTELEKLPAITQEGKNTFGCLLNGVAYTPGGGGPLDRVLTVQYDPTYGMGSLRISAQRFLADSKFMAISIHGDTVNTAGQYPLAFKSKYSIFYMSTLTSCSFATYDPPPPSMIEGLLSITKFDNVNKIISGIFTFKVSTSNCGTFDATDGRFDVKY